MGGKVGVKGFSVPLGVVLIFAACVWPLGANPRERIDFWKQNYGELRAEDDPRAARAQEIFKIVLNAAGRRPGVVPRLYILKKDPHNSPIAIAIPDGWVILSKGALDICYRDPELGDDRVAFVLSHEIAHQLKNDFWHMMFFSAIDISSEKGSAEEGELLKEIRDIAGSTEKVLAKELQADEYGIVYAAMAGFDVGAIVREEGDVNFFEEWVKALDPARVEELPKDDKHPTPSQRAETVKARLRQVVENVELFNIGVLLYETGKYDKAALFFEEFLRYFPSREVYHDLGACHHQLAIVNYRKMKGADFSFAFKLSIAIDPQTRAAGITVRKRGVREKTPEELFRQHMDKAIEYYKAAIDADPSYILAYNNLGCAYILNGDYFDAIAVLKNALKVDPGNARALNNSGVAFFYAENPKKAKEELTKAHELDPSYTDPLFNLGRVSVELGNEAEAAKYWEMYLGVEGTGPWAAIAREAMGVAGGGVEEAASRQGEAEENVGGLLAGSYTDEIPKDWVSVSDRPYTIEEDPYVVKTYKGGVMAICKGEDVLMIAALKGYVGASGRGIAIGSPEGDVLSAYGAPDNRLSTAQGGSLLYEKLGMAFMVSEGKVDSWVIF